MKFGIRKPSFKKSFKAKTTGKLKRKLKKAVNPLYGKKGMGFIRFHFEAHCAGTNSNEITWEEVERRNLGPCGTCVLK